LVVLDLTDSVAVGWKRPYIAIQCTPFPGRSVLVAPDFRRAPASGFAQSRRLESRTWVRFRTTVGWISTMRYCCWQGLLSAETPQRIWR